MFPQKHKSTIIGIHIARLHYLLVLAVFCVFGFATFLATNSSQKVEAATSSTLNFQGRLLNSSGSLVPDGYYNIEFKLYDGGTDGGPGGTGEANAGSLLWTETYYDSNGVTAGNDNRIRIVNGYFSANLGSLTAFGGSINWDQELWLTMNVGGSTQTATPTFDGEMLATGNKRTKLTGVPYAFRAGAVMGANGAYDADDLVQLGPGSVQGINSANTAIRVNQTGAGNLIQLQSGGTDRFVIENDGDIVSSSDGTFQGGDLTVGTASVAGDLTLYDGSSNTGTLAVASLGQNTVYTLPDPGGASDTICLQTLANCAGAGDIVQNGNTFGTAITIGTNDDYGLNFETNGTTKFSLSNTGAALFQNSTNSTTAFQIQNAAGTNLVNVDTTNLNVDLNAQTTIIKSSATNTEWNKVSQTTAGTIASGGQASVQTVRAMTSYNGSLYVATQKSNAVEIFRYDGGTSYTKISQAAGTIAEDGGANTSVTGVYSMVVHNGSLYVGTFDAGGAEVYRYDGGTSWTLVTQSTPGQVASGGTTAIQGIYALTSYNGSLYIGTEKDNEAEVYRYDGGTTWTRVSNAAGQIVGSGVTNIDRARSMAVLNGYLYLGTSTDTAQAQVYRYDGSTWTVVSQATAGTIAEDGGSNTGIATVNAMTTHSGSLYVATSETNETEVYRYDGGTSWTLVTQSTPGTIASGGTSAINSIFGLTSYNGYLYASTSETDSAQVYRYNNTAGSWTLVSQSTAGTIASGGTASIDAGYWLHAHNGSLYLGTNETSSAEIYRYTDNVLEARSNTTNTAFNVGASGNTSFQSAINSTNAFNLQDAAGNSFLNLNSSDAVLSLGDSGIASTIQIGNTSGAVTQTINIGNNSTTGSISNVTIGSTIGGTVALQGPTTITNRTSGSTSSLIVSNSTSTGNIAEFRDNATNVFSLADGGAATFRNASDSTTAFQIQNAAGSSNLLIVDTSNGKIGIGTAPSASGQLLQVSGTVSANAYQANTGNFEFTSAGNGTGSITKGAIADGTITANDVVVSTGSNGSNQQTVNTTTTARDIRVLGVSANSVTATQQANVKILGVATINVDTSAVAVGDQLVTSTTSGRATVDNNATTGIVGYALSTKAGGSNGTVTINIRPSNGQYSPLYRNSSNSTTAFQIQNAAGSSLFTVDTTNSIIDINASVAISGSLALEAGSDFSTTGTSNNVDFGAVSLVRLTGASAQTITGIANGTNGEILTIINAASQAATISNESGSSTAANRIITGTGADISLPAGATITLVYDSTSTRWRVSGAAASTTTSVSNLQGAYDGSTGGTTPEIKLDSTRGGLDIQDANSTIGGSLLTVRASNAGGLGNALFDVSSASVTIGGTSDTTSVLLQGAAAATYTIGTSNNTGGITVGNSTATNTISIGSAAGASNTQTINIGTSSTGSSTTNVNIGSSAGGTVALQGPTTITNRTSGSTSSLIVSNSTSTGNIAEFRDNATNVFSLADGGAATFRNQTDSTNGFQVQNAAGSRALSVTTTDANYANVNIGGSGYSNAYLNFYRGTTLGYSITSESAIDSADGLWFYNNQGTAYAFGLKASDGSATFRSTSTSAFRLQDASGNNLFIADTTNNALTLGSTTGTGTITLGQSTATNTISIGAAAGAGNTQTINLGTSSTGSSTTNVNIGSTVAGTTTIQSPTTTISSATAINLNSGTIATNQASIGLFNTTATTATMLQAATSISVGATTGTFTVRNANTTLGNSAGSGVLTNNGATLNTTLALSNDADGGAIGTAATTVDIYTSVSIAQTTASQTFTIPTPTASTSYGRLLYLSNIGSVAFTVGGVTMNPGTTATLIWSNTNGGASWQFGGADGNGILNQNSTDQTANFRISGTGRANTSFTSPLFDSITGGLSLGTSTATGVTIGGTTNTTSVLLQGAAAATYTIGTSNNTGGITVGNSTATNTISIGAAAGASNTQTINIGTSSTGSSTTNVNIGSTAGGTVALQGPTTITNRTSGSTSSLIVSNSTSTGNIAEFRDNATNVFSLADGGAATFRNQTNSGTAFQIQNAAGSAAFTVGTDDATYAYGVLGGSGYNYSELGFNQGATSQWVIGTDDSSIAGTNGFYINNQAAASDVFGINSNGGAIFRNSTNATTGFQIQNSSSTNIFTVDTTNSRIGINTSSSSYDLSFGGDTARTIGLQTRSTNAAGSGLTISAGSAGSGGSAFAGGALSLQGGSAAGTGNANGGNVILDGGSGVGSGVKGLVVVSNATFNAATVQNFTGSASITQANVDAYSTILISSNAAGYTATLGDPTITTAGRMIYVTNTGSFDMTLSVNGGGTGNTITLKPSTTATMVWNGSDWTAAGASSSTDLQAAYNNTATSAGGAELILNAPGGSADGLTIRNNGTTPITGGLLEVQTSIGSNLFTVNNNATEYANNGGSESSTYTMWTDSSSGGLETTSRTTTSANVATGQGAVSVVTTGVATQGVKNTLSSALTNSLEYQVSFTAKAASTGFSAMDVMYSYDGTVTNVRHCVAGTPYYSTGTASQSGTTITGSGTTFTSAMVGMTFVFADGRSAVISGYTSATSLTAATSQTVSSQNYGIYTAGFTVNTSTWTRVSCNFTAAPSGTTITSSNAIFIRQTDSTTRTFYIDNLSVTVNAETNHAADGSVDSALGTNWTQYDADGGAGTTTVTRDTSTIYDTSGSVSDVTTAHINQGVRNNMTITPSVSTQYLVTFYARSSNTFSDITVGFLPAGGNSAPVSAQLCTDYNTQSVSTSGWTRITCIITTPSSGITDPDLVIYQPTATARTFYVDALTITLNTNNSSNVQIGGGNKGGPTTLFTLDRSNGAPIAANNDAYLGSMYYDTSTGRIQCYEADGWGACGAAPDNYVNLNPEYAGAVLNGSGVGTMTADLCSNDSALSVNSSLCSSGQAKNYYRWTSPQATQQTYSIYVSYQLPQTFNGFSSDDTVQLSARVDSTSNASVTYEMYKSTGSAVTQCGSGETNVITGGGGLADTWYSYGINGNESTGCSFNSSSAGNFVIFKINLKANSNANAYVSTLSFTTTGR